MQLFLGLYKFNTFITLNNINIHRKELTKEKDRTNARYAIRALFDHKNLSVIKEFTPEKSPTNVIRVIKHLVTRLILRFIKEFTPAIVLINAAPV